MKVAYVVPRYGPEVLGGAELGARMLAERLVAVQGWEVEVITTCALDYRTWADEYQPGTVVINGVEVHRLASRAGRDPGFEELSRRVLHPPEAACPEDQQRWVDMQGPLCPDVVERAAASDADVVVFYPYLYYPTVRGVPAVGPRAVMHPAAHDEPPIRLPLFAEVFTGASGLVFQTHGERHLVEKLFPVAHVPQVVMGLGVEEQEGDPASARAALGVGDAPYLVYVGRVDDGKGTGLLASWFGAWKDRVPGDLKVVLAGTVLDPPPPHPDVIVTGPVDEETKWGALRGALGLVQPSPHEAFSILLMEAWTAGLPALVNGRCLATREHCERSGGGLWFTGYASFEAALSRLAGDARLRQELGGHGRRYVERFFRWPGLIRRYAEFLTAVAARARS